MSLRLRTQRRSVDPHARLSLSAAVALVALAALMPLAGGAARASVSGLSTLADAAVATPVDADDLVLAPLAAERAALADDPEFSHRLIVQLSTPSLSEWAAAGTVPRSVAYDAEGLLDDDSPSATAHLARIDAEQQAFLGALAKAAPGARLATYIDEYQRVRPLRYRLVLNGLTVDAGLTADLGRLETALRAIRGVKNVDRDDAHQPTMYDSVGLVNAPLAWDNAAVGGAANAGAGIRAASMDGGVHKDAPMFSGAGYLMPIGFPIGYVENTNGKIIASRVYFRSWDPPAAADDTSWPGATGTSHGVHTAGTMAGNRIDATFPGATVPVQISGVAPRAYLMSYRVFYNSVNGIGSFYNAEGIQALEDVLRDRAHVLNNSWGGGPGSIGGAFDSLDTALLNAFRGGVFVSMSNGNAGPGPGTGDHPSSDYINVAASTKGSAFVPGGLDVTAPGTVPASLKGMPYGDAEFGAVLAIGQVVGPYKARLSATVMVTNTNGCAAFPPGAFTGRAALIERGVCNFSLKAANAQDAGATLAIIYNNPPNGDAIGGMAAGTRAEDVTISTILIGRTNGVAVSEWVTQHGDAAELRIDTTAHLWRSTDHPDDIAPPDWIAGFSSRGPSSAGTLKPDIAAPGVDIMSQGYAPATGEGRHLGFGQVGGTSMASPHVAGAATMIRQIHKDWTPAMIKSALMSTSKYMDVWVGDRPAQPLDMGAGRLDLTNAADPGVILSPPSLSFGWQLVGTSKSIELTLSSVSSGDETYQVTTVDTRGGFTATTTVRGLTVSPTTVTVPAGGTAKLTATWNTTDLPIGDAQGFVVLTGEKYKAHLPAWTRVTPPPSAAEVLIIDADGSRQGAPAPADYTPAYTESLEAMNVSYDVFDAATATGLHVPTASEMKAYKWLIIQTGDNRNTPSLNELDQNHLMEYAASGGWVGVFGQNAAQVLESNNPNGGSSFYGTALAATFQKESINSGTVLTQTQQVLAGAPGSAFNNVSVDISATGDGAGNQVSIDEIKFDTAAGAMPLLRYANGGGIVSQGFVAGAYRDDPTVERPGRAILSRSAYFGFGLEGMNDDTGHLTRGDLLGAVRSWLSTEVSIAVTSDVKPARRQSYFTVKLSAKDADSDATTPTIDTGLRYRATFGDGTGVFETDKLYIAPDGTQEGAAIMGHVWTRPGRYHVVFEGRGAMGITAVHEMNVDVVAGPEFHDWDPIYLPVVLKGEVWK